MRTINADDCEKYFYEHLDDNNIAGAMNAINEMPTVEPEQRWIPVTERLPEDRDWYLGIFKELDTGWINPIPFICDYVGHKTSITTNDLWILKEHEDVEGFGFEYYKGLVCVAWMPLPEPYEGDKK